MKYLLKVWSLTIIIPPIVFWIIISILKNEKISSYPLMFPILITTIIMGFILSTPLMIISVILNHYLINYLSEKWKMKMILNLLFVVGIIGAAAFISEKSLFIYSTELILPIAYLIISSLSIWLFKYDNRQNQ